MLQGKLSNLRALWLLRVSSVCIGVILLYALISKGTREPPAGVAVGRGMPFGTDDEVDGLRRHPELHRDPNPERLLEEEQLAQDLDGQVDGEVDAENVAMEQEADRDSAFSLAKMARLLGWGKDPGADDEEEAGPDDGIGGVVLTGSAHGGILDQPPVAGSDTDWINSPLLRRFIAQFGSRTDLPDKGDSGDSEVDNLAEMDGRGEMEDFTTTTTLAGVLPQQIEHAAV